MTRLSRKGTTQRSKTLIWLTLQSILLFIHGGEVLRAIIHRVRDQDYYSHLVNPVVGVNRWLSIELTGPWTGGP